MTTTTFVYGSERSNLTTNFAETPDQDRLLGKLIGRSGCIGQTGLVTVGELNAFMKF